jgi:EF hand
MPMKLLTLACGLACGFGLAIAVHAAGSRGTDDRRPDRREDIEERGSSMRSNRRDRDDGFGRDDDRGDRREERGEGRRTSRAVDDDRSQRQDEKAGRHERHRGRRGEEVGRREVGDQRRGREKSGGARGDGRRGERPREPEARHPGTGHSRGEREFREFEERGPSGRREFVGRVSGGRLEAPRPAERRGHRFAEFRSGGYGIPHPFHGGHPLAGHPGGGTWRRQSNHGGPRFGHRPGTGYAGFGPGGRHPQFGEYRFAPHHPVEHGSPMRYPVGPYMVGHPFGGNADFFAWGPSHGNGPVPHRYARRVTGPGPMWGGAAVPPQRSPFDHLDQNSDGKITTDEVLHWFAKVDVNNDGFVTRDELGRMIMPGGSPPANSHEKAEGPGTHGRGPEARPHFDPERHPVGPTHGLGPARPGQMGGPGFGPGPRGFGPGGFPEGFGPGGRGPQFGGPGRIGVRSPNAEMILDRFDQDHKGFVTKESVPEGVWDRISKADTNNDGKVSKEELEAHFKSPHHERPEAGAESTKPVESLKEAKPEEKKPEVKPTNSSPQAFHEESELPADAIAASNVVS